ncbi:MAG: hypothetical protein IT545_07490 [Rhodobacteraceae bacterium]|nr:hypothetical protein [Paracoccaceae bacterium]
MPNALAYLALMAWPLVVAGLFLRLPVPRALVWSILGGYLLLPPVAAFNLPGVPALDKVSIPNLAALVATVVALRAGRLAAAARRHARPPVMGAVRTPAEEPAAALAEALRPPPAIWLLLALFLASPLATVLTNTDPALYADGPAVHAIPGLRLYDSVSVIVQQGILLVPFFLARRLLASAAALGDLVRALALAGLALSLPMLLEIRLSPQLNVWVYGFFQHDFLQMMRGGGFRPIVFLEHALWVAFFAMTAVLAALALAREAAAEARPAWIAAALWLAAVLVLSRTLGPLVLLVALAPAVVLAPRRWQHRLAAAMAAVAVLYPLLRGAGLIPTEAIVARIAEFAPDRAHSLAFRFENEDLLLDRAALRPWFGWGSWGRNHLYDPATGRMLTVSDGRWIIVMGVFGWLGYLAEFGLLALPLVWLGLRHGAAAAAPAGVLALILGANMIDLLPNASLIPFTWLVAGALTGHAEALARGRRAPRPAPLPGAAGARPRTQL